MGGSDSLHPAFPNSITLTPHSSHSHWKQPHTFEEGPPAGDGASGAGWGFPGPLGQAYRAPRPNRAHGRPQLHQGQVVVEGPRVKLRREWPRNSDEVWGGGAVPHSESLASVLSPWGAARCGSPAPPLLAPPGAPRLASLSTEARSGHCGTSGESPETLPSAHGHHSAGPHAGLSLSPLFSRGREGGRGRGGPLQ